MEVRVGDRQGAVWIADGEFGESVCCETPNGREAKDERGEVVPDRLPGFAFHDSDGGETARILKDFIADRTALDTVAGEQGFRCAEVAGDEGEFPGEVAGVLNTGVHALTTSGAVNVRCISDEKDTAGAIVCDLAFVDLKTCEPEGGRRLDAAGAAPIEKRLHVVEGWIGWGRVVDGVAYVGDDAVAIMFDGKDDEDAIRVPEDCNFAGIGSAGELDIGEDPIAGHGVADEVHL